MPGAGRRGWGAEMRARLSLIVLAAAVAVLGSAPAPGITASCASSL